MREFIYQIEHTIPTGWITVQGESHRDVAVRIAAKFPPGRIRINVAFNDPENLYENGGPRHSHHFVLDVEKVNETVRCTDSPPG